MKQWKCNVCGYIHEGNEPPDTCPVCGVPASEFSEVPAEPAESVPENESNEPVTVSDVMVETMINWGITHVFGMVTAKSTLSDTLVAIRNGDAAADRVFAVHADGDAVIGDGTVASGGVKATNTTTGFLGIMSCPGVPTGTPISFDSSSGHAGLIYDSTNNRLYVWHQC